MKHKGFTIVELVIVIAVIGILAGITVVGYGTWRDRAAKTEVMSDLRNAALAMKNYLNFNNELPPNLAATGFKESPNVLVVRSADSNTLKYCIQASSRVKTSIVYYVNSISAKDPTVGTCPTLPADPVTEPTNPIVLTGYTSIKSFSSNTCAIALDSKAYCWGGNYYGQLGNGTTTNSQTPVAVSQGAMPAGVTIKQLAVGYNVSCAIASNDKAYCWGNGEYGQLGNGTYTEAQNTPVAVSQGAMPAGATIKQIYQGNSNFCAIASNDRAYCWGNNGSPGISFGTASADGDSNTPVAAVSQGAMPAGATIKQLALSTAPHACGIASDNKAYCWGRNTSGQLGNGTTTNSQTPVAVSQGAMPAGATIKQITVSATNSCAIASNDKAYCWGSNSNGQLGNGTTTNSQTPVAVSQGAMPNGSTFKQIDGLGSDFTTCALGSDNKAYCWGRGGNGELGNGSTADSSTPVALSQFTMPSGLTVSQVIAKCAVMSNSSAYCWGYNNAGQIGNGTTTNSSSPLKVNDPY